MSDPEVQAHSVGDDDEETAGCVIQFNPSFDDSTAAEVQAHSVGDDDEETAGCVVQFNTSVDEGTAGGA
ncbi:hypothetical protein [Streptomyces sp. NPDC051567]|uniref:hypothetical protein n=1 Tax=Streptomyces sp. NPDC051567 TaxID=3365660 RepID=UPI0037B0241B